KISRTFPPAAFSSTSRTVASRMAMVSCLKDRRIARRIVTIDSREWDWSAGLQPAGSRLLPLGRSQLPGAGSIDGLRLGQPLLEKLGRIRTQLVQPLVDDACKIDRELFGAAAGSHGPDQPAPAATRLGQGPQIAGDDQQARGQGFHHGDAARLG